ncbi:hypothetical protein [Microvirga sp. VF16]|uniref:hypothetical protein n=1 Tax=Microvirga sp. VF16 TaxID=2807101 RepID=UPI00193E5D23|nr:hypothetical protein [Microvirga sp. VF16]QRM35978.1 hypothetical protein JO965_47260 [Microvirga sp. VF16]
MRGPVGATPMSGIATFWWDAEWRVPLPLPFGRAGIRHARSGTAGPSVETCK